MKSGHRIAAGGIILRDNRILLVRYARDDGSTYLVGPGGALQVRENAVQAVVRETFEETGVTVSPKKVLFVEDLQCGRYKMCKIWLLCDALDETVRETAGARAEGIVEARWFDREQLVAEVVYPLAVMQHDWWAFAEDDWKVKCLPSVSAEF